MRGERGVCVRKKTKMRLVLWEVYQPLGARKVKEGGGRRDAERGTERFADFLMIGLTRGASACFFARGLRLMTGLESEGGAGFDGAAGGEDGGDGGGWSSSCCGCFS